MYCLCWCIMFVLTILILNFSSRATSLELTMNENSNNYVSNLDISKKLFRDANSQLQTSSARITNPVGIMWPYKN